MEVKVPQRFYDERGVLELKFVEHGCTVGNECMVEHGYVKIIAGATLTKKRYSGIELAHNKAWMREDYRRCNLDQGSFLEYQACAQQSMDA